MAGNGTIGLEILEDLPDPDAVVIPYGGGGLTVGHRQRGQGAPARHEDLHRRARDGRRAGRGARPPGSRPTSTTAPRSWTARAAGACWTACGRWCRRSWTTRWRSRWPRSPPPCGRSPSGSGSSPRARARSPPAAALSGRAGTGKIVCVVSGGNINLNKLAEILGGADG